MSKAWAEKNKDETYAHRNTRCAGLFMPKQWAPDQRVLLEPKPHWWGKGKFPSNVTEVVYTPIKADATRTAALLSDEIDFIIDLSLQDLTRIRQTPNLKVLEGAEYRAIFLGLDQFRDELPGSDVKGNNPLKDARVRKASYQTIDINASQHATLCGLAQPTGALIAYQVNGWTPKADVRWPFEAKATQKLLADERGDNAQQLHRKSADSRRRVDLAHPAVQPGHSLGCRGKKSTCHTVSTTASTGACSRSTDLFLT